MSDAKAPSQEAYDVAREIREVIKAQGDTSVWLDLRPLAPIIATAIDTAVQAADSRIAELETERSELYRTISDLTRSVDGYDAIGEYRQLPKAMHDAVSDVILDALPGEGDRHDALHKARMALLALEMKPR